MLKIAIGGATCLVGQTFLQVLEEKEIQADYTLFASSKSKGKIINFMNKDYEVQELTKDINFNSYDYALFSAGSEIAKEYAPLFAKNGAVVIDNSSAFRMDKDVPLVVPEVNSEDIKDNHGIIANPNCSTIQAVVALKPLDDKYKIKRIIYSTYQAVSGAGQKGIEDFENTSKGLEPKKWPHPIYNNCLPHIDVFQENGYTKEEMKMIEETKKILHRDDLKVTATTVRVPVINSHSESINVEFFNDFDINELKELLKNSPGIVLEDDVDNNIYPLATNATDSDEVYVGRLRRDDTVDFGINMWVVADNIRKGAASNAVQILEQLLK